MPLPSSRPSFLRFSPQMLAIAAIAGCAFFLWLTLKQGQDELRNQLAQNMDYTRMHLVTQASNELALAAKMADDPLVEAWMLYPKGPEARRQAEEALDRYRRHFRSGIAFWVSNADKTFHSRTATGTVRYQVDPALPENYWYDLSLYRTERYNLNINYNPDLKVTHLWVNAPVFSGTGTARKPIGIVGTGIDLTAFVESVYAAQNSFDLYIFNASGEITVAHKIALARDKVKLHTHLGGVAERIIELALQQKGSDPVYFQDDGRLYGVAAVPDMGWFLVDSVPLRFMTLMNPQAMIFFIIFMVLLALLFKLSIAQTRLVTQNRSLEILRQEALAASVAKGRFLAQMSHEIRTPMSAILGVAELLLREKIAPAIREKVLEIRRAGNNMIAIINDILDFSRIESGKLEVLEAEYELGSLIFDLASIVKTRLVGKDVHLSILIDGNSPSLLLGDETRVRQILSNLLTNAAKFTRHGSIRLDLQVQWLTPEPASVRIVRLVFRVSDSGIGIRPEDVEKLFGDFVQVGMDYNRGMEGTGLGLAISRNLARLMGGDITVESVYGTGSVFTASFLQKVGRYLPVAVVTQAEQKPVLCYDPENTAPELPAILKNLGVRVDIASSREALQETLAQSVPAFVFAPASLTAHVLAELSTDETAAPAAVPEVVALEDARYPFHPPEHCVALLPSPIWSALVANVLNHQPLRHDEGATHVGRFILPEARVLVVDDIEVNLRVARGLLAQYELTVDCADSGAEAIAMTERAHYDLIFMDHMMPEMDGIEAVGAIRALGGWRAEVPIVALTANAVSGMREKFLASGFSDFLAKPIEVSKLNAILERWIAPEQRQPARVQEETSAGSAPEIPEAIAPFTGIFGLDTTLGLARIGGDASSYAEVLASFIESARDRLLYLRAEDRSALASAAHALKSACANIGAMPLSEAAADLERHSATLSPAALAEPLATFRERLETLVDAIAGALLKAERIPPETGVAEVAPESVALARAFAAALKAEDLGQMDTLLGQLKAHALPPRWHRILHQVSEHILLARFAEAGKLIESLLA
ncbi:MAG: response regulator [Zoogloeaceae bacterium]|nr:response regulator [Zoogloeaceae bacterium]